MKTKTIASLVAMGALAVTAPLAHANAILELISGGNTSTANSVNGVATFMGSVGGWSINVTTGLAGPADGGTANTLDVSSTDFTAPGTAVPLEILWMVSPYSGTGTYEASIGGTLDSGTTLSFKTFYNSMLLTTALTFGGSPFAGSDYGTVPDSTPAPFMLTEEVTLSGGQAGAQSSFDANLSLIAVPDGGPTLVLLGGGIAAMSLVCPKKRDLK